MEHSACVAVVALNGARLVPVSHILVSQECRHQFGFLGILRLLGYSLLELLRLNKTNRVADLLQSEQDVTQQVRMIVEGLENRTLFRCGCKKDDRLCRLVDGRELGGSVVLFERATAEYGKDLDPAHITVGLEVSLELTVIAARGEVTYTHDFGIQAVVCNSIQNDPFGKELGVYIAVIEELPEVQFALGKQRYSLAVLAIKPDLAN